MSDTLSPLVLQNAVLPSAYTVSLAVDATKPNFSGRVCMPLAENPQANTLAGHARSMTLHAHKLVITKAELRLPDGSLHKTSVDHDRHAQTATFGSEIPLAGNELIVSYLASISYIKTFRDETYGVFKTNYSDSLLGNSNNYVIATHAQPFGCRMIFPVIDELSHKVPIFLAITTDSKFQVASNARLDSKTFVDETNNAVFQFERTPPITPSVFGFVLGDLESLSSNAGDVPVRALVTIGDSALARYALNVACELLVVFEKLLGVKYPLPKLDIVALPVLSDAVMENWGLITVIKDTIFLDEHSSSADMKSHVRSLVAHQLTHQWIGNLVSIDDWSYTWLIEAFATFVGNYILSIVAMEETDKSEYLSGKSAAMQELMDTDCFSDNSIPSLHEHMTKLDVSVSSRTNTIFEKNAYEKGLVLLNMIASLFKLENEEENLDSFFNAFSEVLVKFSFKTIKPFQIWEVLNGHLSVDLLSFVYSWIRRVGLPVVIVKQQNGSIFVEQNQFIYNSSAAELNLENNPFHVPLAIKVLKDDKSTTYVNLVLSDRSMKLDIPPDQFLSLNSDNQFYYKTVYDPLQQSVILRNVATNAYTSLDLIGMIEDYGKILGQPVSGQHSSCFGINQCRFLMQICEVFAEPDWNLNYNVLKHALNYIEFINSIFLQLTPYTEFKTWIDALGIKLYRKLGGWPEAMNVSTPYNCTEFEVRNIVLQLASHDKEVQLLSRKQFKSFLSSGLTQKFIPKEMYSSMFNITMATASMTEYKQILALVKNANVSHLNHTNGTANDIQTAAVSSLSFCRKQELISKTLHFVDANIDSKMIELALIGFKFKYDKESKSLIWNWFKTNYDSWIKRSLRKGSDWSKQIGVTSANISRLVLCEVMGKESDEVINFIGVKTKSLPPHKLKESFEEWQSELEEKRRIAAYYNELF